MPTDPNYFNALMAYRQQLLQQRQQNQAAREQKNAQQQADRLSAEYQQKLFEANQKNEQRYLDILEGRTGTRDRVLGDLANWGQSQINDANDRYASLKSQMLGDVYSRGFGGSPSMLGSAKRSAENARDRELNRINDEIIGRRTNADAGLSDSLYSFMERRNDVAPDLSQLIALQQGLGRTGPLFSTPGGGYQYPNPGFTPPATGAPAPPQQTPPFKVGLPPKHPQRPTPGAPIRTLPGNGMPVRPSPQPYPSAQPGMQPGMQAPKIGVMAQSLNGMTMNPARQAPTSLTQYRQADSLNTPAAPLLPWQGANMLGDSPGTKLPVTGAGYNPLYQQMPILGVFGAGLQKFGGGGDGGDYPYPMFQFPSQYGQAPMFQSPLPQTQLPSANLQKKRRESEQAYRDAWQRWYSNPSNHAQHILSSGH